MADWPFGPSETPNGHIQNPKEEQQVLCKRPVLKLFLQSYYLFSFGIEEQDFAFRSISL